MGERLVVPASTRKHILDILHGSHFGAEKCKSRAMQAVYWPRILKEIEDQVAHCQICQRHQRTNIKEPMLPREIPAIPWTKVGGDILDFRGTYYLLVVDYTSKFPDLATLGKTKTTAAAIITKLRAIFARFEIPREFMADNMPFSSREMVQFAKEWGHGQRGSIARAEKNLGRGRFSKFSHSTKYALTKKKRRLGNAEPRSTEARRQMLLNTSWSHTSQAGLFWDIRLSN